MKIRYRSISGEIKEVDIKPAQNLRDGSENCLNDYISDQLDDLKIKYKWFRIIK